MFIHREQYEDAHDTRRADRDERIVTCRYLRRGYAGQCTAEAVGGFDAEILLCPKHLARTVEFLRNHAPALIGASQ